MTISVIIGILGGQELIIIVILVLLLFGGKKIPELMRGLGKGIREFKDASNTVNNEVMKGFRDIDKNIVDDLESDKKSEAEKEENSSEKQ